MPIIDSHTHLMTLNTQLYPLADPTSGYKPKTEGSAEHLKAQMNAAGVERALAISTGFYGWDNSYAMDELVSNNSWLTIGVLVDPTVKDGPHNLEILVKKGANGIRIQRHLFYHQSLDDPISTPLWEKAAALDLTVDVNATHEEYSAVEKRIREFPDTRFVLDHCGYVSGNLAPKKNTTEPVRRLARYKNVYIKLTFLPLASQQPYPFKDVHWMVRELVDAFGPDRCLFGSNFPTDQYSPKTSYQETVTLFSEAINLSHEEREWIMGGTANSLWNWV